MRTKHARSSLVVLFLVLGMAVAVSAFQSVEQRLLTAIRAGDLEDAEFWLADPAINLIGRILPSGEAFLPLREAIATGSVDMVKLLVEAGAEVRGSRSDLVGGYFYPLL